MRMRFFGSSVQSEARIRNPLVSCQRADERWAFTYEVCIIYDFLTDTAVEAVPSVEWVTIEARPTPGRFGSSFTFSLGLQSLEEVARRTNPIPLTYLRPLSLTPVTLGIA